ncbi:hypothetical protein ACFLIM_40015 [Nonomuraea sp. M3C6]|uniref:Phenylacetic acid degradation bifunctional protein PaaZ n=1 Tax=Nonomuraea marmarensis TaxID=3351344 RepID=A0ABW7AT48_9ACTN
MSTLESYLEGTWRAGGGEGVPVADALPPGVIQLVAGSIPGLFDLLGGQDHIGFTGSAATAARLRSDPAVPAARRARRPRPA